MTNTVARLEAFGCVQIREDASDKRRKLVSLTAKGMRVREEAIADVTPVFAEVTEKFGRERLREILPTLRDLRIFLSNG